MVTSAEQRTLDWYRTRLGNITGSMVGVLMKEGRNDTFSETAKAYLYQLAAERSMNPAIVDDDELFEMYLYQVDVTTKAMRFGTEQESKAREIYERMANVRVGEVGSCRHPSIPHFASSPDGYHPSESGGGHVCLEIKVPSQATFMRYREEIGDNDSLLRVKPEYFYQCMAHMMVTGADETRFVVFNPFQNDPMHIVRILPDENVFAKMEERIRLANLFIDNIIYHIEYGE